MAAHENPTSAFTTDSENIPTLGRRLANLLLGTGTPGSAHGGRRLAAWLRNERGSLGEDLDGEDVIPRFPLVRQGYDCAAVDAYVGELERDIAELDRELVALRPRAAPPDEVATEIKRIGEQTSSVLIAAHEQKEEILRAAREEAERCVVDARATATATTAEAEARVRDLEAKREAAHRQHERLLEDARTVSAELAALAGDRVPAEISGD